MYCASASLTHRRAPVDLLGCGGVLTGDQLLEAADLWLSLVYDVHAYTVVRRAARDPHVAGIKQCHAVGQALRLH